MGGCPGCVYADDWAGCVPGARRWVAWVSGVCLCLLFYLSVALSLSLSLCQRGVGGAYMSRGGWIRVEACARMHVFL